jgi:hypothetical protein
MKLGTKLLAAALLALPMAAWSETPTELWQQGYKITWKSDYEDVEECTPENGVVLSDEIIFICDSYEYMYHYGPVFIASKSFTYKGHTLTTNYLCLDGEGKCLSGTLVRKRGS